MSDESDLPAPQGNHLERLPPALRTMLDGRPMPDVAAWVRASREEH